MTTFDELVASAAPEQKQIAVADTLITVQELSGEDRFEVIDRADEPRWQLMRWIAFRGMVEPTKPAEESDLDKLSADHVLEIANAVCDLSGISEDAVDEAGKESASVAAIGGS